MNGMTTGKDRESTLSGYFASGWPVECGGNRRQKAAPGGLQASDTEPDVTTRINDRWNVMVIRRAEDELYLGGTMPAWEGPPPFGWVERIDPESLQPIHESPRLPCGDHVWCGAIAAHQNGDIIKVNGNYVHRLDTDCGVVCEAQLPIDRAHNGLLILSDGSIVTKDLRLAGQGRSTITRLHPDRLELLGEPLELPEGSMGRIAADVDAGGNEFIYIPGIEKVWRIRVYPDHMEVDGDWTPQYRDADGDQGLAWDGCISDGALWLMDNGDIVAVRAIFGQHPNGRFGTRSRSLSFWRNPAPWRGRQRLLKLSLSDATVQSIAPFDNKAGCIIAPPVHVPELQMCFTWDSINGGLAGISTRNDEMSVAWRIDARPSMQPVVFPETGELVINDYHRGDDQLIVVDMRTGDVLSRASTGSRLANGMFLTPGKNQDIYYCSTLAISRVSWQQ